MYPLAGLILCGGRSSRMIEDKCMISYHGVPQVRYLFSMLAPLVQEVCISCRPDQVDVIANSFENSGLDPLIASDAPEYAGHGPLSGLLTAWDSMKGRSLLVVACDYPLVTSDDLNALIAARRPANSAVCYNRNHLDEPLVAIYENDLDPFVHHSFEQGEYSLRRLLSVIRTTRITPSRSEHFDSVDTPEHARLVMTMLQSRKSN